MNAIKSLGGGGEGFSGAAPPRRAANSNAPPANNKNFRKAFVPNLPGAGSVMESEQRRT